MNVPYLENLTVRLAAGAAVLPADQTERHRDFFRSAQQPDGGFKGREGGSDLYYSGFALRGLAILGGLNEEVGAPAAKFLASRLTGQESIVDFLSLVYGAKLIEMFCDIDVFADVTGNWREAVASALNELRREDGGFAKGPEGRASSTYHSFLVLLCLQLIDAPIAEPEKLVQFIFSQECEDGGFREIKVSKRAGTNPTAAAIATLTMLSGTNKEVAEGTIDLLFEMQTDEGGLRANTRIPIADLLSTFTGLVTLQDLKAAEEINLVAVRKYVDSLEHAEGGFHGAVWDERRDVEYSFYGLGCLALLQDVDPHAT